MPSTVEFNRQTYTYENHIISISDGVSYYFLNTTAANLSGGRSNAITYPLDSACYNLGDLVSESATCQTNEGAASTYNGWDRPITQMVKVSSNFFHNNTYGPTSVYVVTLGNTPSVGLEDGVASSPRVSGQAQLLAPISLRFAGDVCAR